MLEFDDGIFELPLKKIPSSETMRLQPCLAHHILMMLAVGCTLARVPDSALQEWLQFPPGCPTNINNATELEQFKAFEGVYVSVYLVGGFGNELSQMAMAITLARQRDIAHIIGHWRHEYYNPYGTRTPPAPGITMKHIFPNIVYLDYLPKYNLQNITCSANDKLEFPDNEQLKKTPVLMGHGMHLKRAFVVDEFRALISIV